MEPFFSLIYTSPDEAGSASFAAAGDITKPLGADWFLWNKNLNWMEYITDNPETIRYREEMFADLASCPALIGICESCAEALDNMNELRKIKEGTETNESMLYSIKEVEVYLDFVDSLSQGLEALRDRLSSRAFKALYESIRQTADSAEYLALRRGVSELSLSVKSIRSLTVGINLDAKLSPYEAGIVSVNAEFFRSGNLIDRFMRMDGKPDEMMTLAPLSAAAKNFTGHEKSIADMAINAALKKIVGSGLHGWQAMLKQYFRMNTRKYIRLLPEFRFLLGGAKVMEKLTALKLPFCFPSVCPGTEKRFSATGLYNPAVAEKLSSSDPDARIVPNDFSFDKTGMLYVLTGPNRGGKSVILCAVGIAQLMCQLGLPVAAESAEISPVDAVYTHFSADSGSTVGKGRLGEECARMQALLEKVTGDSLVLLDETFSGTDSYEASAIAAEVLAGLAAFGCRGIYATHLHELSERVDEINRSPRTLSPVDNLVAGMENGVRSFRVSREKPDGRSYARDIANAYGLSLDKILSLKKQKN